jgi:hypothetical protein
MVSQLEIKSGNPLKTSGLDETGGKHAEKKKR